MADRFGIPGRTISLYVQFVDASGEPTNADTTPTVAIIDSEGSTLRASSNIGISLSQDPGLYKLDYNIPLTGVDGYAFDVWSAKIGNETIIGEFEFLILDSGGVSAAVKPNPTPGDDATWTYTEEEVENINILLKVIKARIKNDGIRKVSDGAGGTIEEICSIFTDDELICFLQNSLSTFNQYPHFTNYTFANIQVSDLFLDIIAQGAVLLALAAQALIEKGREFSINDSGVTYQPPQVADILSGQYSAQLADYKEKLKMIKCSLKPGPRSLGTFRVTAISPNYLRLRHLRARQLI